MGAEPLQETRQTEKNVSQPNPLRVDPVTGLPLPDPYPDYVRCPHCGEEEVEVWCYQSQVQCHNCGQWIEHTPPPGCGTYPFCKRGKQDGATEG
jgi:hypothetical protein